MYPSTNEAASAPSLWPAAAAGSLTAVVLKVADQFTAVGTIGQYATVAAGVALAWGAVVGLTNMPLRWMQHRPRWQGIVLLAAVAGLAAALASWGWDHLFGAV